MLAGQSGGIREALLEVAALDHAIVIEPRVLQVVGVSDADDVLKGVGPAFAKARLRAQRQGQDRHIINAPRDDQAHLAFLAQVFRRRHSAALRARRKRQHALYKTLSGREWPDGARPRYGRKESVPRGRRPGVFEGDARPHLRRRLIE